MADAAISFAVEKLGDALIQKVKFLKGVEDQVRWLKEELQRMRCFLKDAAEKQGQDESVRQWISDVREVAQDAEDVIDIFTLRVETPTRNRGSDCFPVHACHLSRVGKEIESIRSRLDEIGERRERYGIRNLEELGMELGTDELKRRMKVRNQKDKDVVGLNEDADLLLKNIILDEERKGLALAVVEGMGGIGKSTLARKIYNHPDVAARFGEKRAWVVVSSKFVVEDIVMLIMHELSFSLKRKELEALDNIQGKLRRQEMLQQMLRKRLEGECYFIVLDDVWEDSHWDVLSTAFPNEQDKASRLLFTSRNRILQEQRGYVHKMRLLNSDESWELLLKTALISRRCQQELKDICREILEKCHGLPLAITVAGGLLVKQGESKSGWNRVLKQIKNYHLGTSEMVSPVLELSYHNLPSELKPCFLCLSFFKEDVIRAKSLVHIWIVLGLVKVQEAGDESVEERARIYLDELLNRNLILVKGTSMDNHRVNYFHVHDFLRELSIRKAKEEIGFECLIRERDQMSASSSSYKPRHRVVRVITKDLIQAGTSMNQNKHVRTLFIHVEDVPRYVEAYFSTPSYWKGFELLRILDIEGNILEGLSSTSIRALTGIRYLKLRGRNGVRLPRWLDVLKKQEVLDTAECEGLIFPDVTWNMDHLLHFYINNRCDFSDSMKKSSWKNLRTLKYMSSSNFLLDNPIQVYSERLHKLGVQVRVGGKVMLRRLLEKSAAQVVHLRWSYLRYNIVDLPIPSFLDHLTKLKLHGHISLKILLT